jgi:hypothetical protein
MSGRAYSMPRLDFCVRHRARRPLTPATFRQIFARTPESCDLLTTVTIDGINAIGDDCMQCNAGKTCT